MMTNFVVARGAWNTLEGLCFVAHGAFFLVPWGGRLLTVLATLEKTFGEMKK
jgi:hypothetical protein